MRFGILPPALFLVLVGVGCGGGEAEPTPTPTIEATATPDVSGPELALAQYVEETMSKILVEDCSTAVAEVDTGKICSILRGERGNLRAYILGLTFSEPFQWAILEDQGAAWRVVYSPAIKSVNTGIPGIPWPLASGTDVVVVGASPCVNVREGPGLDQTAVDCLDDGTVIKLSVGPITADDFEWWQLDGRAGWIVSDFLRYPDSIEPLQEPTEAPAEATATPSPP